MSEKNEKYGGWISVKDKLPEMSNCVLITDGENIEMSRYDEGVWRTESPCCYGEILYWQPLPDISEIYLETYEKEQKMKIIIEGNAENVSFILDRIRKTFAVKSVAKNHFKISDLDDETFRERAIETLKAIISKVEEEAKKTQENKTHGGKSKNAKNIL